MASKKEAGVRQLLKRQFDARDDELELFTLRLNKFLGKNVKRILKGVGREDETALQAAQALGGLKESLQAAGLNEVLGKVDSLYERELESIQARFAKVNKKDLILTNVDVDTIQALIRFDANRIGGYVNTYVDEMSSVIMRAKLGGQRVDIDEVEANFGETIAARVKTEVDTSLSGFSRSVTFNKAQGLGFEKFLYLGPDDQITREFCAERVGKVFTLKQIEGWDNGQGLPADIYLGGYNCRHELVPVDDEDIKELSLDGL